MIRVPNHLFLDLDGVLADFDAGFEKLFGSRPDRTKGDNHVPNMWKRIEDHGSFFFDLEPLADWEELWDYAKSYNPIILTGAPKELHFVGQQKRAWVRKFIGSEVPVICCPSRAKYYNADPGDALVDDWTKYKSLWEHVGGHWITHTSAKSSIEQLEDYYATPLTNTEYDNDH